MAGRRGGASLRGGGVLPLRGAFTLPTHGTYFQRVAAASKMVGTHVYSVDRTRAAVCGRHQKSGYRVAAGLFSRPRHSGEAPDGNLISNQCPHEALCGEALTHLVMMGAGARRLLLTFSHV